MNLQQGTTVYLRHVTKADAPQILHSVNDEEIRYFTGTHGTFTLAQIEQHIEKCAVDDTRVDFVVCLTETDEVIGEGAIVEIDEDNQLAYYRIAMFPHILGKGYGTEATKLAIRYTFDVLKLNRLQLEVYSHNARAIRSYEKVGFLYEGTRREVLLWDGKYSDEIIMSILRKDYITMDRKFQRI